MLLLGWRRGRRGVDLGFGEKPEGTWFWMGAAEQAESREDREAAPA